MAKLFLKFAQFKTRLHHEYIWTEVKGKEDSWQLLVGNEITATVEKKDDKWLGQVVDTSTVDHLFTDCISFDDIATKCEKLIQKLAQSYSGSLKLTFSLRK